MGRSLSLERTRSERRAAAAAVGLLCLGLSAMAADLFGASRLGALLRLTSAAPAPGAPLRRALDLDVPRTRLFVLFDDGVAPVELDSARFAGLEGPSSRRALFRLALAQGPSLDADPGLRPLFRALVERAFSESSSLRGELELDPTGSIVGLQWQPAEPSEGSETWVFEFGASLENAGRSGEEGDW